MILVTHHQTTGYGAMIDPLLTDMNQHTIRHITALSFMVIAVGNVLFGTVLMLSSRYRGGEWWKRWRTLQGIWSYSMALLSGWGAYMFVQDDEPNLDWQGMLIVVFGAVVSIIAFVRFLVEDTNPDNWKI